MPVTYLILVCDRPGDLVVYRGVTDARVIAMARANPNAFVFEETS